ncbi:hypothetical protein [Micromonospora parastrephiae]|uniref:hypothetical protein n=1 Tax=Micromonospora parastrephiae TaxID=2806101 RepID=UPI003899668A
MHPGGIRTRVTENVRIGSGVSHEEYAAGRAQFEKLLTIAPERPPRGSCAVSNGAGVGC